MTVIITAQDAGFLDTWRALVRRRWRAGAAVFFILFALAAAILFLSRPVYRAEARLKLGEPPPSGGITPTGGGLLGLPRLGSDAFANDLSLISSRTLTEHLVEDVGLNAIVDAPRGWHRDSLFVRFRTTRATQKARFDVEWLDNGQVRVAQTAPVEALVGEVAPGASYTFGGMTVAFRARRAGAPQKIEIQTLPFGDAVRVTRGKIQSERTRREANSLDLRFDNTDPAIAKAAVTSVVTRFVQLRTVIQRRESSETIDSLRAVANETNTELQKAELAIESIATTSRLVAPDTQSKAIVGRYTEALGQLERAKADLDAVNSVLRRVDAVENPADAWTALVAYPRFLENPTMGDMLNRLTQLETRRAELLQRRTTDNIEYRVVKDQITYLDRSLRSLASSHRTTLAEQVGNLEARVAGMDSVLGRVPGQLVETGRRQRSVRILSEFLVLSELRLRQEELREALTFANVQVIDPPELRYRPIWPRKKLGLAVGFLLAGMSALLAMIVAERTSAPARREPAPSASAPYRERDFTAAGD